MINSGKIVSEKRFSHIHRLLLLIVNLKKENKR